MDLYGIGIALKGMVRIYQETARRSGRTTLMLDRLKNGDRVICLVTHEAHRLKQLCRERGLDVEISTCPPDDPGRLFERGTPQGATIFDHSWVEKFFELQVANVIDSFDHLQRELSGRCEAHRETRRRAEELASQMTFEPGPRGKGHTK